MDTAVLFETFARPQYARQVFDQIKKAKPKKLYFYSNKARVDRPDEVRNNEEIRSWVKEVDWDCELHTFFREEYVDVYTSVRGAMDWVFDNEEQDTHSGGSGCGCSAITLAGYILKQLREGSWKRVLFVPTGALLSTVSYNEGQNIPGIAHGVIIERE